MTRIVAAHAQEHLPGFYAALTLERCTPSTAAYAAFWARHYPGSKGAIGRQLHYLVWYERRVLGIIAAGEPMFRNRARDRHLGLTYAALTQPPPRWLISCTAFRLEEAPYGLASQAVAAWRAAVVRDMRAAYGDEVRWFETQVGPGRDGCCFRRDGWRKVGYTTGRGARRGPGHGHTAREWKDTPKNMVLVRSV